MAFLITAVIGRTSANNVDTEYIELTSVFVVIPTQNYVPATVREVPYRI